MGVTVDAGSRGVDQPASASRWQGSVPAAVSLAAEDRERCRAAVAWAREVHPGAIGHLVERELRAYADLGYRFDAERLVPLLAEDVLATAARSKNPVSPGGSM